MSATPLLDRINSRKPRTDPLPIAERAGPFAKRLLAKQLPPKEVQTFMHDGCGPDDSGRAA